MSPTTTAVAPQTPSARLTVLPDYAPIPKSALGPALNDQGYYVGRVERNLYWVTDGVYQSAFLTTADGVVLLDAPPTIGNNLRRAVDEIASANGVTNKITHLVYSHHHADHVGASSLFDKNVTRIGHEETRRLLLRDNDPARPVPDEVFQDRRTLEIGGERIELAWRGSNHTPDNIFIHLPDHDTLMLIDIVNVRWAPFGIVNLSEDIPGYIEAPTTALSYPWKHFIGGHLGRLGTRDDVVLHQEYMADIVEKVKSAMGKVDPTPYFQKYGDDAWAGVKAYLDEITDVAAAPVITKYTGVWPPRTRRFRSRRCVSRTTISRACSIGSSEWDTMQTSWAFDRSIPRSVGTASAPGLASRTGQPRDNARSLRHIAEA